MVPAFEPMTNGLAYPAPLVVQKGGTKGCAARQTVAICNLVICNFKFERRAVLKAWAAKPNYKFEI
jgi:hypothetical protein